MNNQMLSLLGIARRAGRLALGSDAAAEAMRKGPAKLLLLAGDLSTRSAEKMLALAQDAGVAAEQLAVTMEDISMALGKRTGVVAVNDAGFAEKLHALCASE